MLSSGQGLRRHHGETRPVDDGAELGALVVERAGRSDGEPIDPEQPPERLARSVIGALRGGAPGPVRPLLAGLRRAALYPAEHRPASELTARADALAAVAGGLVVHDSERVLLGVALDDAPRAVRRRAVPASVAHCPPGPRSPAS